MGFFAALDKRRVATALVVLMTAFLTGNILQNYLADDAPVATINGGPDAAPVLRRGDRQKPLPVPPAATLTPILQTPPVLPERTQEASASDPEAHAARDCAPSLRLDAAPAATVSVTVDAHCHPDTVVEVSQGPIRIEERTDQSGRLELRMPALDKMPEIEIRVAGAILKAVTEVSDASQFQHVAILWQGPQALRINAYEFGARKSQFGHVWSGSPKSPSRASRGSGGFLTRLGDDGGASTEIYSFPAGHTPLRGVVRLVVEAEVTRDSCGREVQATALQTGPLGRLSETEVKLALPGCERLGEIIQLQNLLQDMRLAGR